MRGKKKNMHFRSLVMSFEAIVDITKKVPSLMGLIVFTEYNKSFGVENHIYWTPE